MTARFLIRFILLAIGFALTTLGLLAWQQVHFRLDNMWPLGDTFEFHAVHVLILGIALIPPTLWDIFVLDTQQFHSQQGSQDLRDDPLDNDTATDHGQVLKTE